MCLPSSLNRKLFKGNGKRRLSVNLTGGLFLFLSCLSLSVSFRLLIHQSISFFSPTNTLPFWVCVTQDNEEEEKKLEAKDDDDEGEE